MSKVWSFLPEIDLETRVLILGSMPGVKSLKEQKYYANPMNQFWRIIYSIFDTPLDNDYDKRIGFIKSKGIGLWDVIESCHRPGSLDSNIKSAKVNDFKALFASHANITCVIFNGGKAYETFKGAVGFEQFNFVKFIKMPSTSPANTIKFEEKLREWAIIKNFLIAKQKP